MIYFHIPFCPPRIEPKDAPRSSYNRKCGFCTLLSRPLDDDDLGGFVSLMVDELGLYDGILSAGRNHLVSMLFGGGTPSVIDPKDYRPLFDAVIGMFGSLDSQMQVTMEAAPDTFASSEAKAISRLASYVDVGFNRISFGVQTFQPDELRLIGRYANDFSIRHMKNLISHSRKGGFRSVNMDQMIGLPGQTAQSLSANLDIIDAVRPDSVSLYTTLVRGNCGFAAAAREGVFDLCPNSLIDDLYFLAGSRLDAIGYNQINVSHWITDDFSLNLQQENAFNMVPEIGIGPGSRSMAPDHHYSIDFRVRNQDVDSLISLWKGSVQSGGFPATMGVLLDSDEQKRKYMIFSLSSRTGLDIDGYSARFGSSPQKDFPDQFGFLSSKGLIGLDDGRISLTKQGMQSSGAILPMFYSSKVQAKDRSASARAYSA